MSNSHWYHLFLHDACGVIRSKINFFSGGKVCLVGASGEHVPLLPPLGSGTVYWKKYVKLVLVNRLGVLKSRARLFKAYEVVS